MFEINEDQEEKGKRGKEDRREDRLKHTLFHQCKQLPTQMLHTQYSSLSLRC